MQASVIVKTVKEQANIAYATQSALASVAETAGVGEVTVAEFLLENATIATALKFPTRFVQLAATRDRCCGGGTQPGFSLGEGQCTYALGGDIEYEPVVRPHSADVLNANPIRVWWGIG